VLMPNSSAAAIAYRTPMLSGDTWISDASACERGARGPYGAL